MYSKYMIPDTKDTSPSADYTLLNINSVKLSKLILKLMYSA